MGRGCHGPRGGNTLVSGGNARVVEVDTSGAVVWQYPGTGATTWSVAWILNPTTGFSATTGMPFAVSSS